jgi:hypothetical protein
MSQSEQFRQYAEEALLSVCQAKDEDEIQALAELAHVWVLAAFEIERAEAACKTVR